MPVIKDQLILSEKIALLEKKAKNIGQRLASQSEHESVIQALADRLSLIGYSDDMLLAQFRQNMNAFKVFDRNIYEFFSDYQPSRYLVDIVDGFPNILDTEKNKYFYEYPAYLMANVQLARHQKSPESASALFDVEDKNEAGFMHSDALNQILQVLWRRMEKNDGQVRELSKVVNAAMVFGIGCGYHLELLCSQHKIKNLYVIEPELDLFYASLFTANWQHILNKVDQFGLNIHISLGEQEDDFFEHILKQSRHYGRYEIAKTFGFIHYHNEKTEALVDQYKSRFDEAIRGWGFFDDAVMAVSHMLTSLQQGVPLLKKKQITDNLFADYPVFIIGNGPSLDGLIELIKRYQHQAIIISCGSALSALYQYGITPDIHCEQERTSPVAEQLDYYCSPETLEQIILFGPSTLHPDVYAKFPVKVMAAKGAEPTAPLLMESRLAELFEIHSHINPTVANTAASVAVGFGFKNIYFLGVDLGHKKGSSHHSKKSIYYGNDGEDMELYDASSVLEQERKGNFGGVFYTNPFFDSSKRALERLTAENSELNFYNLSDGVLIQGAKPIAPDLLTFHHDAIDNKQSKLRELVKTCSYQDSGKLFNELSNNLDFAGFEDLCLALVRTIDELNYHFEDCLDLIKRHYLMLIDEKICLRDHFYYLLEGSMMHIQAMLTRILYEAVDEGDAIEDFREALSSYREFLLDAISYYKKNALTPLYHESSWFDVIINSDSKNN